MKMLWIFCTRTRVILRLVLLLCSPTISHAQYYLEETLNSYIGPDSLFSSRQIIIANKVQSYKKICQYGKSPNGNRDEAGYFNSDGYISKLKRGGLTLNISRNAEGTLVKIIQHNRWRKKVSEIRVIEKNDTGITWRYIITEKKDTLQDKVWCFTNDGKIIPMFTNGPDFIMHHDSGFLIVSTLGIKIYDITNYYTTYNRDSSIKYQVVERRKPDGVLFRKEYVATYYEHNRIKKISYPESNDTRAYTIYYDSLQRPIQKMTEWDGLLWEIEYLENNLPGKITYFDKGGKIDCQCRFEYTYR